MLGFPKWLLFGICSASIGGAIWVAISHFANAEVGYVALGIGFLAGVGVRFGAGDENEGFLPGVAAVIAAVAVILFAKWMSVTLAVNAAFAGADGTAFEVPDFANDRDAAIAWTADDLLENRDPEGLGAGLDWPAGQSYLTAERPEHYPPALREEAAEAWDGLDDAGRQAQITEWTPPPDALDDMKDVIRMQAFQANFSPWDLLWFGLAAFTAFGLGSGAAGGDD